MPSEGPETHLRAPRRGRKGRDIGLGKKRAIEPFYRLIAYFKKDLLLFRKKEGGKEGKREKGIFFFLLSFSFFLYLFLSFLSLLLLLCPFSFFAFLSFVLFFFRPFLSSFFFWEGGEGKEGGYTPGGGQGGRGYLPRKFFPFSQGYPKKIFSNKSVACISEGVPLVPLKRRFDDLGRMWLMETPASLASPPP